MGKIKIISPGFLTTVQDKGRYGYQQFGVPASGVMDNFAHRIANILVENHELEAVLEVTMLGPQIEFHSVEIISITGGDLSPRINGKEVSMCRSIKVNKGDVLSFAGMKSGCRSYIAFSGGIEVPVIMESKSTYMKGRFGGYEGRNLKVGDLLNIAQSETVFKERIVPDKYIPKYNNELDVRVVLGPQTEYFTDKGIETFLSNEYKVTNECDRMGFRLDGAEIEHVDGADIISDGIGFGAIQIPGHGKPIIMMADRQTTGGYTKIGNVISADLYKIAQAKPGDKIKFKGISVEEAQDILKEEEEKISSIKKECLSKEIISSKKYFLKINGKSYNVKVEEVK
ncbi:5-oxoprolinase subunit C family protein [Anaeromicrobium sediminis]|uniref:KipI antagonist n=1 Tax=Anaeromicrobium sediminis TaxID=1478221 RepID=A0A267MIP6_9FIRM|nr:biotin-dependent carboxyltransferase family protein [Anaeromicrobium sediminis]PAB58798.1 KipI antagonist [Anaeromicrobium sediminis]